RRIGTGRTVTRPIGFATVGFARLPDAPAGRQQSVPGPQSREKQGKGIPLQGIGPVSIDAVARTDPVAHEPVATVAGLAHDPWIRIQSRPGGVFGCHEAGPYPVAWPAWRP